MRAFGKVHPLPLFTYFIVMLLFSMFLRNPVIVLLSLLGSGAFAATLTDRREKLSDLKFYIPLSVLIAVTNPLYSHNGRTPLFFVNGNAFTLEAVAYGVFIAAMIIAVLMWSKSYSKIVTGDKFLYLFGRVTPKTALILSVALRYVPILNRQAQKTRETQKTLGLFSTGSVADNLVSGAKVYSALVGWSLENAVETGRHMRSRGWGRGKRTSFSVFTSAFPTAFCSALRCSAPCCWGWPPRAGRCASASTPPPRRCRFRRCRWRPISASARWRFYPF